MKAPQTNSQAGGFVIAAAIIAGVVGGAIAGQPSMGVIAGAAVGIALATWIWLRDRAR